MLTQYQKLRLLTAAGMEGPAEQGGSDGYERRGGVCLAVVAGGTWTQKGESEGRVWGAGSRKGELRDGVKEGSQAFSNHFGTLGRRDCPGGTKGLGCSLSVPDPCQARMVWQRGEQLLPSASFPPLPHHPVVFSFKVP